MYHKELWELCASQSENIRVFATSFTLSRSRYDQLDCTNVALVVSNFCNTKYHICIY